MKRITMALAFALAAIPALAQMADGEIRKVDKGAKKITIKHGEVKSIDMPPMTMVFQVRDPALLDKVKAGDKVKFQAEKAGEQIDTTDWHSGVGAEGGIVSNAKDTATFLTALMRGKLLDQGQLKAMKGDNLWLGGTYSCAGQVYGWSGGGSGYKTEVWVNDDGSRVAVLLLNARHYDTAQPEADQAAHATLTSLYCGA